LNELIVPNYLFGIEVFFKSSESEVEIEESIFDRIFEIFEEVIKQVVLFDQEGIMEAVH